MAIEVFHGTPSGEKSFRISFSHDLPKTDAVHIGSRSSSSHDFDFCAFRASFEKVFSSADELFSGGKILPIEIKKRLSRSRTSDAPLPPPQFLETAKNKSVYAKASSPGSDSEEKEQNHKPSSFWSFKRSTNLNSSRGYARTFCLPPVFAGSYSWGSAGSAKFSPISNSPKQNNVKNSPKSASCAVNHQRPPLKNNINNHAINYRIKKLDPVLNIPLANIFGLGSIFRGGKYKSKKKY